MTCPELLPLARYTANCRVDPLDTALRNRLRTTFLDWGSAAIAGTGHALAQQYQDALLRPGESGPSRVIGTQTRYPVSAAAMANAAISHLWEVDDAHRDATAHPGIAVVPVVLALAEAHAIKAADVCAAVVAGYETILRVGSHLGAAHYKINHSTATAGTLGAAAAAARALQLNQEQTLWAFGHAGTQAAGLWAFLDDGVDAAKAFHAATAVRNGIDAAQLAAAGIPAASRVLEGPRGMRASWKLEGCDPAWLIPGDEPMIHTVTVKGWPVCGQMHSALDCAVTLFERHPELAASDVPVTVGLPESAVAIAGRTAPSTVSEAKFSSSFCIAAALCGLRPDLPGLRDALLANRRIHERAESVTLKVIPEFTQRFPEERPASVTLHAAEGPVSESRSYRRGDPEEPWSNTEMNQRCVEVLGLTHHESDVSALVLWAEDLASQSTEWLAGDFYNCLPSTAIVCY